MNPHGGSVLEEHGPTRHPLAKETIAMANPVVHFEIIGKDGDATKQFFADLFGWSIDSNNPMNYGLVDPGANGEGRGIAGGISGAMAGQDGYVTVYVQVDDVEAALAKAESLGATRMFGPETIMEGLTIGIFAEPEGKPVGVLHQSA
jgi:predicted enzyme related to lactoylglutathione lyase